MNIGSGKDLVYELRRRHTFRTAGLYIVGAWLVMQAADVFFPAWGLPDAAINVLLAMAVLGFPLALVFGWFYDITGAGIVRTPPADTTDEQLALPLQRKDYVLLMALGLIAAYIVYDGVQDIVRAPRVSPAPQLADVELPKKREHSIAVLPFVNMSSEPDNEYFADGLSEEILHRLAEFRSLHVVARTSSFAFKDSDYRAPRISNLLGVQYLLQGSARKHGDQLRVTVQLVDDTGAQQWSDDFDRSFADIFAIQKEIAAAVVASVGPRVAPASLRDYEPDIDAYQEYLIGRDYFRRRPPDWHTDAIAAYRRAIEFDPAYAAPYAGIAIAIVIAGGGDFFDYAERIAEAHGYVEQALELDPDLAEAYAARGLLSQKGLQPDLIAAERDLRRAIELDPQLVPAYNWLVNALIQQERYTEAQQLREAALQIDPLNPILNVNAAQHFSDRGDFDSAERLLLRQMQLPRPGGSVYIALTQLYRDYGHMVETYDWLLKAKSVLDDDAWPIWALTSHTRLLGMREESDAWFEQYVELNKDDPFLMAFMPTYLLKIDGRFDEMARVVEESLSIKAEEFANLPRWVVEVLGIVNVLSGNYDEGISILERFVDPDAPRSAIGGMSGVYVSQWFAYAHRQLGEKEKAMSILLKLEAYLSHLAEVTHAANPGFYESRALNQVMLGNLDEAAEIMATAIETGWRNYYWIAEDPLWQPFRAHPLARELMAFVREDLERQRQQVKALQASANPASIRSSAKRIVRPLLAVSRR